jgi:hypothetical protein
VRIQGTAEVPGDNDLEGVAQCSKHHLQRWILGPNGGPKLDRSDGINKQMCVFMQPILPQF